MPGTLPDTPATGNELASLVRLEKPVCARSFTQSTSVEQRTYRLVPLQTNSDF